MRVNSLLMLGAFCAYVSTALSQTTVSTTTTVTTRTTVTHTSTTSTTTTLPPTQVPTSSPTIDCDFNQQLHCLRKAGCGWDTNFEDCYSCTAIPFENDCEHTLHCAWDSGACIHESPAPTDTPTTGPTGTESPTTVPTDAPTLEPTDVPTGGPTELCHTGLTTQESCEEVNGCIWQGLYCYHCEHVHYALICQPRCNWTEDGCVANTTSAPTMAPTGAPSVSLAPTTPAPVSLAPTTTAPVTSAPVTSAPTTLAPTQAPTDTPDENTTDVTLVYMHYLLTSEYYPHATTNFTSLDGTTLETTSNASILKYAHRPEPEYDPDTYYDCLVNTSCNASAIIENNVKSMYNVNASSPHDYSAGQLDQTNLTEQFTATIATLYSSISSYKSNASVLFTHSNTVSLVFILRVYEHSNGTTISPSHGATVAANTVAALNSKYASSPTSLDLTVYHPNGTIHSKYTAYPTGNDVTGGTNKVARTVQTTSAAAEEPETETVTIDSDDDTLVIALSTVGGVVGLALIAFMGIYFYKHTPVKGYGALSSSYVPSGNPP